MNGNGTSQNDTFGLSNADFHELTRSYLGQRTASPQTQLEKGGTRCSVPDHDKVIAMFHIFL